uniref:Uncharacterized protein n=1 Tax=Lepeophtheirus salmonis TaxID=72036 RepID=A0A0K2TDW0_LEPSM
MNKKSHATTIFPFLISELSFFLTKMPILIIINVLCQRKLQFHGPQTFLPTKSYQNFHLVILYSIKYLLLILITKNSQTLH